MATCPVCGDQVVNGTCRFCGMPYRNDDAMYHLNESSQEHYRHVSSSVKKKMREAAVPLGDKARQGRGPVTRAQMQAKQQQIRQEAMRKMTQAAPGTATARASRTTANINGKTKKIKTNQTTYSALSAKTMSGKRRGFRIVWIMLFLFLLAFYSESCISAIQNLTGSYSGSSSFDIPEEGGRIRFLDIPYAVESLK